MKPSHRSPRRPLVKSVASLLTASLLCSFSASAASYQWQTAGTTDTWSGTGGDTNWFIDAGITLSPWVDGNDAVFSAATGETVTLSGTLTPITLTIGANNGAWIFNGAGSVGGALTKTGTGSLSFNNTVASTFTSLALSGTGALRVLDTNNVLGSGQITLGSNFTIGRSTGATAATVTSLANNIALGSNTLTFDTTLGALSPTGIISGAGNLLFNAGAARQLVLTGANTYTGITSIFGSNTTTPTPGQAVNVTSIGNGGVAGNLGAATSAAANLTFGVNGQTAGQLNYIGSGESTDRLFTLTANAVISNNGTGALNFTNTGSLAHPTAATHSLTLGGTYTGAANTFAPVISNGTGSAVSLTKSEAGTWRLTGTNTYTGVTTITGGILAGITANAFGNTSGINIQGAGTLSLRGDADTSFVRTTGGAAYPVTTTASNATINVDQATAGGTSAKTMIIGSIGTSSTATGYQLNFTGANSTSLTAGAVTGPASATAGTVTLSNSNLLGTTTLASYTSANVSGGETLTFSNNGNTVITGAVTPSATVLALSKGGTGTVTLAGANTYTGASTVTGGVLLFARQTALYNNNVASWTAANLIVNSGATAAFNVGGTGEFTAANIDTLQTLTNVASGVTATQGFRNGSSIGLDTTNAAGGTFTYGSVLANHVAGATTDTLGLRKLGTGTLQLTGANTYTGTTIVSGGTLQIGDGTAVGALGAGAVTVSTGATLSFKRNDTVALGNSFAASAGTLSVDGSGTVNVTSTPANGLLPTNVVVNSGTLQFSNGAFSGDRLNGSGVITVNSGATLSITADHGLGGNNIAMTDSVIVNGGTVTLSNPQYFTNLTLNGGTVNGSGTQLLRSGGTTNYQITGSSASTISASVGLYTAANWNVPDVTSSSAADLTISGAITDLNGTSSGGMIKTGAGTLVLSASSSTYTGGTTVNGGTLSLTGGGNFGSGNNAVGAGALTVTNATVTTSGGAFRIEGRTDATNNRVVSLTNSTLNLSNSEYFKTLSLDGSTVNASTATTDYLRAPAAGFSINAAGANSTITGRVDLTQASATVDVASGTQLTVSGPISENSGAGSGAKSLTKSSAGTLTLGGASSFSGGTTIRQGAINVQNAGSLGTSSVTLGDASTGAGNTALYIDTNRTTFARAVVVSNNGSGTDTLGTRATVVGSGSGNGFTNVTLARNVIFDSNAADRTDYTNISGTGNITITGTGRTIFSAANSFTGDITVSLGSSANATFQSGVGSGNTDYIPDTSSLTVNLTAGNTLAQYRLSSGGESINGLNGDGNIDTNATGGTTLTLTVGAANAGGTFSGSLKNGTNTLSFAKTGTGTQILSGTNTYTGGTAVNAGILTYLNTNAKPASGTTTVAANATLGLGVATSGSFFTSANVDSLFAGTLANVTNDATSNVGIDTTAGDFTYATSISSTRGLTKLGSNKLTLTGANSSYTGPTNVTGGTLAVGGSISGTTSINITGGTLLLGASNLINDAANVTLGTSGVAGGTFRTGGFSEFAGTGNGTGAGLGTLTLSENSTIDFGAGTSTLWFSGIGAFTAGKTLTIDNNWSGDSAGGGTDQLRFTSDPSAALSQINFTGFSGAGEIFFSNGGNSYFEIVAIPEPSSTGLLGAVALLGIVGLREWRRCDKFIRRPPNS